MSGSATRLVEGAVRYRAQKSVYDVLIVGAGVVGCALARRFSQTGLSVAVVERASDVGEGGASKSNSAIAHCGFDADPGSLEAKLVMSASRRWPDLARHLKIPYASTGALMVAKSEEDMQSLRKYQKRSLENGVLDIEMLDGKQARDLEPFVFEGQLLAGALHIPREDVVDPFATCAAFAETALEQGSCDFFFQAEVDYVHQPREPKVGNDSSLVVVRATRQNLELCARNVINSCGLGARQLADSYGGAPFTLNPRRGQFLVFDALSRPLLNKILLPVPGPLGKGILITPTIFGNLLAGPTAEDLPLEQQSEATQTTRTGLDSVRSSVFVSLPRLAEFSPVAQYAGARSNCAEGSFIFRYGDGAPGIVTLAGIRSTGLSASFAIADEVFEQMNVRGMIQPKREFHCEGRKDYPTWYRPRSSFTGDDALTMCFCENVPRGAVKEALSSPLCPPATDAIKRRTRATTGRCQGFNCLVDVCRQVAKERSISLSSVSKRGPGSEWFPSYKNTLPPAYLKPVASSSSAVTHYTRTEAFQRSQLYLDASKAGKQASIFQGDPEALFDVVVIGGGPAGLGAVAGLSASPKIDRILVLERSDRVGGIPARYPMDSSKKTFVHWAKGKLVSGFDFAEELKTEVFSDTPAARKTDILLNATAMSIERVSAKERFRVKTNQGCSVLARAVVIATGAREASQVERGNVTGHRPSGVVYSNHLLSAGDLKSAAISVGAGLVPRSILEPSHGTVEYVSHSLDENPWVAQWHFGGGRARKMGNELRLFQDERGRVAEIAIDDVRRASAALVLGGCLVPNAEILRRSGFHPQTLPRGVFLAGNVKADRKAGAEPWPGVACYLHAKTLLAKTILASL